MPKHQPRTFDVSALVVDSQNLFVAAGTAIEILLPTGGHEWGIACAVAPATTFDDARHDVTVTAPSGFEIRGPATLDVTRRGEAHATLQVRFDFGVGPSEGFPLHGEM
jgi:hypothetical protein